ncbi:TRAP transporter permease [Prauserella flavalba]|uniref:TRAP transporter permease n=1 Tax=Prauserella flavalba TaxID=1477506 RepID=UPI0036E1423B
MTGTDTADVAAEELDANSLPRIRQGGIASVVAVLALAMSVFQLVTVDYRFVSQHGKFIIHVGFALAIVLIWKGIGLTRSGRTRPARWSVIAGVGAAVVVAAISAVAVGSYYEQSALAGTDKPLWVLAASAFMLLALYIASARIVGILMPTIALIFFLYAHFAYAFPGFLQARGIDFDRLLDRLFLTAEGIYSPVTGVSATFIFIFILFGAVLKHSGATDFYARLASAAFGRTRGGAAKVAVVASAAFAMVSGSSIANTASTGQFTIPMMKRSGFKPKFAAGVESVAAMGGEVTPPFMAGLVFIVASMLGVGWGEIVIAAIPIAILLYLSLFMSVHLEALRSGIGGAEEGDRVRVRDVAKTGWFYLLPPLVLLALLLLQFPPERAGLLSVLSVPVILFFTKRRMSWKSLLSAGVDGGLMGGSIAVIIVVASVIGGIINFTGLGLTFSSGLIDLAGGSLIAMIFIGLAAAIILGIGLPVVTSYVIMAVMVAPALVELGAPELGAHLFVLYGAMLSQISPPVAPTVVVASTIAGSGFWESSWVAMRLAVSKFLLPIMLITVPGMLMDGSFLDVTTAILRAIPVVGLAVIAIQGFGRKNDNSGAALLWRVVAGVGSVLLMFPNTVTDILGVACTVAVVLAWVALARAARKARLAAVTLEEETV